MKSRKYNPKFESWRLTLKRVIEERQTPTGTLFYLVIQSLIVLSLLSFSIETIPNLPSSTRGVLNAFEVFCVGVFTLEYFLRIWVSDNRLKFVVSFYGVVDLVAILPFYLSNGIDLRSVRIFRLFRVFRALKLFRYTKAIARLIHAFHLVREELTIFLVVVVFLLYLTSVGIYYFEHDAQPNEFGSIFHCLWWAVATLTSVGYGDVYPITPGGKIFTVFVLIIGMGTVAVPSGLVASALTQVLTTENKIAAEVADTRDTSRPGR